MKDMGLEPTKEDVIELFNELDTDGNGKIGFTEFLAGMRWLQKGGLINSKVDQTPTEAARRTSAPPAERPTFHKVAEKTDQRPTNLQERNTILENCLKDIVTRGMNLAETHYRAKEYDQASLVLDALDMGTLIDMEPFIGQISTEKQKDHYQKMKRRLDTK